MILIVIEYCSLGLHFTHYSKYSVRFIHTTTSHRPTVCTRYLLVYVQYCAQLQCTTVYKYYIISN